VNTLSPGDRVLMFETGHFATLWREMARRFGLEVDFVGGDWRSGVDPTVVEQRLSEDEGHSYKAVAVVHNETSTGVTTRVSDVRRAIDRTGHPALFMVDTISSLGSIDYCHNEWRVDVTVGCSQKGLMLPPGLGFNAVSDKALAAAETAALPRSYWSWQDMLAANAAGFFPYTPATNLLFGLREAIAMLLERGLESVFARHDRHAEATRRAVRAWGLEVLCKDPREYSSSLTAVLLPEGHDADRLCRLILERFDMSLGVGLGKLRGRVFRIGHLGDFNDLMLMGTLSGVEAGLRLAGVPVASNGVSPALDYL
jgi:alanine-glyoxylate transaminase / serine-glyoxylate transaminase / serine-pyruvate transaminase